MSRKRPKALVAREDGQPAEVVMDKNVKAVGKRIGFVDFAFADPGRHNRGVGSALCGPL